MLETGKIRDYDLYCMLSRRADEFLEHHVSIYIEYQRATNITMRVACGCVSMGSSMTTLFMYKCWGEWCSIHQDRRVCRKERQLLLLLPYFLVVVVVTAGVAVVVRVKGVL